MSGGEAGLLARIGAASTLDELTAIEADVTLRAASLTADGVESLRLAWFTRWNELDSRPHPAHAARAVPIPLARLELRAADTLVVAAPDALTPAEIRQFERRVQQRVDEIHPGCGVLALPHGSDVLGLLTAPERPGPPPTLTPWLQRLAANADAVRDPAAPDGRPEPTT